MDKSEIYAVLERNYFSDQPHEKDVIDHLPLLIKGNAVVVDAGASLGQYTRAMNRILDHGEVHAIEADPIRVEQLRRNCDEWQAISTNKLVAHHAALTDRTGDVSYFVTNSDISGGLVPHETEHEVHWEEITIPASTLDSLFPARHPDFIKIDVEGAEVSVLNGARGILAAGRTTFMIETHDWNDEARTSNEVGRLMEGAGYKSVSFFGHAVFVKSRSRWLKLKLLELRDTRRFLRRVGARLQAARS